MASETANQQVTKMKCWCMLSCTTPHSVNYVTVQYEQLNNFKAIFKLNTKMVLVYLICNTEVHLSIYVYIITRDFFSSQKVITSMATATFWFKANTVHCPLTWK